MIRTESLSKFFQSDHREIKAVDGLNLQVNEGEVFGFLGPNGAGKTTTVRILACLIGPTAGHAWVNGLEVGKADAQIRSQIGILTESPGLYERLSARRNLEIFAELYDVKDVRGQVEKYLRLLDLWDRRDTEAGTFSKGMKQKLAIARALLHEPPVVFMDEPTSALDPEAAKTVRDFIETLRGQGPHDLPVHPQPGRGRAAVRTDRRLPPAFDRRGHARRAAPAALRPADGGAPGAGEHSESRGGRPVDRHRARAVLRETCRSAAG